ncbi:MAG: DNA recombination protein RmuC [Acidobacteriaceae bacterium]
MNMVAVMGVVGLAVLGLLVGWWLGSRSEQAAVERLRGERETLVADRTRFETRAEVLQRLAAAQKIDLDAARAEASEVREQATRLQAQVEEAQRSVAREQESLAKAREELTKTFEGLAAKALQENNAQFLGLANRELSAKEESIEKLLSPVRETLGKLADQTQGLEVKREGAYKELQEQVRQFQELGLGLKSETSKLSTALKNPSTTGQWGEFVLERVVKLAGMTEHCDFSRQVTSKDGNYRPDLVVHWPNGRNIIVDSKTSVKSYQEAHEAVDESQRRKKLEEHAQQIRQHVDQLGRKKYDESFEDSIDLVVCFIPGEIFFFAAQQIDPEIVEYAARQKVIFATPTTLIALLKAASFGWRQDSMRREAKQILEMSQQVYDRLTTAAGHMRKLGKDIKSSVDSYDELLGSLERMVLPAARKMKDLGLSGKDIPEVEPLDRVPRQMQSPDWKLIDVSKGGPTSVPDDGPLALAAAEERQEE